MELIKPIFVKRWITENTYINYVFDINLNNNYTNTIIISEYIFRDVNINNILNKIAYHIFDYETKIGNNISYPFYIWSSHNNIDKSLMFNIKNILWKGYHPNPFKSNNRDSQLLKEPIEYEYTEDIFDIDDINIVFYNDFKYDIKYYYPDKKKLLPDLNKKLEKETIDLYNSKIVKTKEKKEEYFKISFSQKYDIESLIVLFDNFKTSDTIQLIQLINNNNAIYKLYKSHTIDEAKLTGIFKLNNRDTDPSINIYYKNEDVILNISKEGIFTIDIKYHMNKGENISVINNVKKDIINYISDYFNVRDDDFKVTNINSRITYSVDYIDTSLLNKLGTYANIFQDYEKYDKKNSHEKNNGFYIYKRHDNIDTEKYIKNRNKYRKIKANELFNELKNLGINKTIAEINGIIKNIDEIENYKLNKNKNEENNSTIYVIINNDNIEIITENFKSFFEINNLKYWLIRIIEKSRNATIKQPKKKIESPKEIVPVKNISSSSSKSSTSKKSKDSISKSSSKDDDEYIINDDEIGTSSSGGGKNKEHFLINKLKIADKELWNGDNPPRRCQRPKQPIVLTDEELKELKKNGYDKKLDNIIIHGSRENNLNYYTCPRVWCPISNIPLDENDIKEGRKCPDENEEPIMMNDIMKNSNNPRYAYIINKYNLPCCGNKNPELKKANIAKVVNPIDPQNKEKKGKVGKKTQKNADIKDDNIQQNIDNTLDTSINGNNYIMTQIPVIYKNRYGNIRKELYYVLYDNYKNYINKCINRNNINKHNCILRKGLKDIPINKKLNNYDNIMEVIAYLLNKTKEGLINDIKLKLNIVKFLSLENGNVFKDFADTEPIIPELNEELYIELLNNFKCEYIVYPDANDNSKKSLYIKSRLLHIYKSYKKFINYLKSDDNKYEKNIQYIFSLVAILYKKLLVSWEIDKGLNNDVQIICPYYTNIEQILPYLGKNPKMIMIYKDNNNDNDINKSIYEPIVSKSINIVAENKYFNLHEHRNIKDIINKCSNENKVNNIDIYENKENIKAILRSISNKTNDYDADIYNFKVLIINSDLSIDKIILNNNIIIKFKKQSIITINLLLETFDIKNIVFSEDINGIEYLFTIKNDLHKYFVEDMKKYNIEIENFEIIKENKNITKGKIKFIDNELDDNILLESDYFSKYHKYVIKNEQNVKEMYEIRKYIKDKLLSNIYTDDYYNNLSKNKKTHIIGTLLKNILSNSDSKLYNKKDLQIILEEINISSRIDIKNWFSMSLEKFKYDYINDISENIIETDNELIFSQYLVHNNIPKKIVSYKNYYPNTIDYTKNPREIAYNIEPGIESKNEIINIPKIFKGTEEELNSKWKKYTKKIWSKLRYIKVNYNKNYIKELYDFLINFDKNIITNIYSFKNIIEYTYKEYENILCEVIDIDDNRRNNKKLIKKIFQDPHFFNIYIKAMNAVNKTDKKFKPSALTIFFETYFNNSSIEERRSIINYIKKEDLIQYFSDITIKLISKWLNINIFIIYDKIEYGQGKKVDKRAGNKDLNLTSVFYRAGYKSSDILYRPLIMLYREKIKTTENIAYYIIKITDSETYMYKELDDAPEEIKNKLISIKYNSGDSLLSDSI